MAAPRILFAAARNFKRALPLLRDVRVPLYLKFATAFIALLIISPLDVFSDIPVLGLLDDAVLLTLLCWLFVSVAQRLLEKDVTPSAHRPISALPRIT